MAETEEFEFVEDTSHHKDIVCGECGKKVKKPINKKGVKVCPFCGEEL